MPFADRTLDPIDWLLLLAFLLIAGLGIWTRCLMVNDGAVFIAALWFGNAWDLYLNQIASRAVSTLALFGPAWLARSVFDLTPDRFLVMVHALYFAVPLVLWQVIRIAQSHPAFARLYLAVCLVLVYFPTELVVGIGLWTIWAAFVVNPTRSAPQLAATTLGLGTALVFTHPAAILMTVLYTATGAVLSFSTRPLPRHVWAASGAMVVLLSAGYLATSRFLPATNPTIARALAENSHDFIDPWWMLATVGRSPMLLALWLLMLAPAANAAALRWRATPAALVVTAAFGLWFAVNGVTQATWIYVRHTGVHVLALAMALALAAPAADWTRQARQALGFFAMIAVAAALSYSVDLVLLERYIGSRLAPGYVDAETLRDPPWPQARQAPSLRRVLFKWTAGEDYVRDVVVPDHDWYLLTLAFESFFMSDRTSVLFHRISDAGWVPLECPPVRRALERARDEHDAVFLRFVLATGYCVP